MLNDFLSLFYPRPCAACGLPLLKAEQVICLPCRHGLPLTSFTAWSDNPVARIFWGRLPVHLATAFLYFRRGNAGQRLVHALKYRGHREIGTEMGVAIGDELQAAGFGSVADMVVPVPLFRTKEKRRGFNQSLCLAEGIASRLGIMPETGAVIRTRDSGTQTKRSRFMRWQNVDTIFRVSAPERLANRHVLLVDDVITTGATLEACAARILEVPGARVSVAALAYASH